MSVDHSRNAGACPNCGLQLPQYQSLCPNCGANITPIPATQWPPPPSGFTPPAPPFSKLFTGNSVADMVIGFVLVFVSLALYGIGLIAMPVLYLSLRETYRYLARGVGYGLATFGVLVLGMFVWCAAGLSGVIH